MTSFGGGRRLSFPGRVSIVPGQMNGASEACCRADADGAVIAATQSATRTEAMEVRCERRITVDRREGRSTCAQRLIVSREARPERWVMREDAALQRPQLGSRLDAEFVVETMPYGREQLERVDLTAAAVESEHQARREALPVRVQVGQATQLGQELVVLPELEANVDLDLDGSEALLLEERPNVCRERFAAQAGERLSTPDGETFRQQTSRLARIPGIHALSRRADEEPKPREIELVRVELETVRRSVASDPLAPDHST